MDQLLKYIQTTVSDNDWDSVLRACADSVDTGDTKEDNKAIERLVKMMRVSNFFVCIFLIVGRNW